MTLYTCSTRAGGFGGLDIWVAQKVGETWQAPTNLGGTVNSSANDSPVWVSGDGNILVFKSDRAGGYGGQDLYFTTKSGTTWTTPQNLGPALNSSGDEMGASFHCNNNNLGGVIFIGSNRAGGYGGYDLWTATEENYAAVTPSSLGRVKALLK